MPSLLSYPSNLVKVFSKHIFYIVNNFKGQQCECTKADSLILKKDWGCVIKKNRKQNLEELRQASRVPLEHMFNHHDNCRVEWCLNTRASAEGKEYNEKMMNYAANKIQPDVKTPKKDYFLVSNRRSSERITKYF